MVLCSSNFSVLVLLAFYSEDVMRTVEREVRKSEAMIRQKYPGAEYIELEPMSVDVDRLAIDGTAIQSKTSSYMRQVYSLSPLLCSFFAQTISRRNCDESKVKR